jgi:peptidoglycan hydrolase-like protein with peptidoglycan-binding domain
MGSKGDNARLLQHNLNQCGATLEEDGIFGKLSTAALVRWQHANGLTADGIYGKLSAAKMKEILQ